jgi:hypothetical protein
VPNTHGSRIECQLRPASPLRRSSPVQNGLLVQRLAVSQASLGPSVVKEIGQLQRPPRSRLHGRSLARIGSGPHAALLTAGPATTAGHASDEPPPDACQHPSHTTSITRRCDNRLSPPSTRACLRHLRQAVRHRPFDGLDRRPWDNAVAETFFASLTKELLRRELFATQERARLRSFCRIPRP